MSIISRASATNLYFNSSFPIWIPLISFFGLTAIIRTSKAILNNSGKSGSFLLADRSQKVGFKVIATEYDTALGFCIGPLLF